MPTCAVPAAHPREFFELVLAKAFMPRLATPLYSVLQAEFTTIPAFCPADSSEMGIVTCSQHPSAHLFGSRSPEIGMYHSKSIGHSTFRQRRKRRRRQLHRNRRMVMENLEVRHLLAAIGWDGGGDGASWHDPLNWDSDSLPTVADDVVIDVPEDVTVRHTTGDTEINSLTLAENFELAGGSMLIPAGVTTTADLRLLDGARLSTARSSVQGVDGGRLTISRGTLDGASLRIPSALAASGQLEIANGIELFSQLTADNSSLITFKPTENGQQLLSGTGTLVINGGGGSTRSAVKVEGDTTLTIDSGVTIRAGMTSIFGDNAGSQSLNNRGTLIVDRHGFGSDQSVSLDFENITNQGIFRVTNNETLIVRRDLSSTGLVQVDAGSTIQIDGTLMLATDSDLTFEINGVAEFERGVLSVGDTAEMAGDLNAVFGFAPSTDLIFPLIEFGSANGAFSQLRAFGLQPGFGIATDVDNSTLSLQTLEVGNQSPRALADFHHVIGGGSVTIDVLANDIDPDGNSLAVSLVSEPSNGSVSLNADSSIQYQASPDFIGEDVFRYRIEDGLGGQDETDVTVFVEAAHPGTPEAIRQIINRGIESLRAGEDQYEQSFRSDTAGLPFFGPNAGRLGNFLSIGDILSDRSFQTLTTIDEQLETFSDVRTALEDLGYAVACVSGEPGCESGVFVEFRFNPVPELLSASAATASLAGTPLAALENEASLSGSVDTFGELAVDHGFGVDRTGFYVTSDSSISTALDVEARIGGSVDLFDIGIQAAVKFAPAVSFASLDSSHDQRIHESEFSGRLDRLELTSGPIDMQLTLDATLGFLDYVDVDPLLSNRAHGGDPFVIRATSSLHAQPSQFSVDSFAGLSSQWTRVRALNPDVNQDGFPDYTQAVFLKNALHLSEDLINGNGVLDYFSNVLDIDGAQLASGVPGALANELPGGKLPQDFVPLPDERVAIDTINEFARSLIILEVGPESLDELIQRQRNELRNWFFADDDDHIDPEGAPGPPESVQFRISKIAPVARDDMLPSRLIELISPIPNTPEGDLQFDELLTEALLDYISWHRNLAVFGFDPVDIVGPLPGEPPTSDNSGEARLQTIEKALIEGLTEAVTRAIDRAKSRIGTEAANSDVDALLKDAADALGWSAEAARLATLAPGFDFRPFDERGGITRDEVLEKLPFRIVVQSAELVGPATAATLTVQAGIELDNPQGGTFAPVPHPRVHVLVTPGVNTDISGLKPNTSAVSNPHISKTVGATDANGQFVTQAQLGPVDRDLNLNVTAALDGLLGFEQTTVTKKGEVTIDVQGFLPIVTNSDATLRDQSILVPQGHDVQIMAQLSRGNGPIALRSVSFFLIGDGTLSSVVSETDSDGKAVSFFSAPVESDSDLTVLGVAYFEDGVLYRDTMDIRHVPTEQFIESEGAVPHSLFASLPQSEHEAGFQEALEGLQTALQDPVSFADLSDGQKDGIIPLLQTWFAQVVIPQLDNGTSSDDLMSRALRDYLGWKNAVKLLDLEESDVILAGTPTGDLTSANALLVTGLRNAIFRAETRLAGATSLAPLYEAIEWSANATSVGVNVEEFQLTPDDILQQFGIVANLTDVELTGTAKNALLSANVTLTIAGEVPDFDVPVQLLVIPSGTSTVAIDSAQVNTQGTFITTAGIGPLDSELKLELKAGIAGFDLANAVKAMAGDVRIELSGFEGGKATEPVRGTLNISAGEIAGIQIDAYRGNVLLQDADLQIKLLGPGRLEATTMNSGLGGGGIVEYYPPLSVSAGTTIVAVSFVDSDRSIVEENIAIRFTSSAAATGGLTDDARLAAQRINELLDALPKDANGDPELGLLDIDDLYTVFRDWFRGFDTHPEFGSVQSRLSDVQPDSPTAPAAYPAFRASLGNAIDDLLRWQTNAELLAIDDPLDIFRGHELGGLSAEQEMQATLDKMAPALREAITRQDTLVQTAGFDFHVMRAAALEVLNILDTAALLGIDASTDGLNIDQSIRDSLAFPTEDEELAEGQLRQLFLANDDAILFDEAGQAFLNPTFLDQVRPVLKDWFVSSSNTTVMSQLQELQPGSSTAPTDYDTFANRLKKSLRNYLAWLARVQEFRLDIEDVLGVDTGEFARARTLISDALRDAVDRVGARSAEDIEQLPSDPSQEELDAVLSRAKEAVEWFEIAKFLGLHSPGSGLSEDEIVGALAFSAEIVPATSSILTRLESATNEPTLRVQAGVRIGDVAQLLFTDQLQVHVTPHGQNSASTTSGSTDAQTGVFSSTISLGSNESVFRFDVATRLFGLRFSEQQIVRRAPVDIHITGALSSAGEAALGNTPLESINGQPIRLRIALGQGNAQLAGQILFLGTIGAGDLSSTSVRTSLRGEADVTFTPPADKIGHTTIVATFFQEGRLHQDVFDVSFTSTAAEATVVPPVSAEEAAATAQLNAIINRAGLEALQGNDVDFLSDLIPPMRTWHRDGVMARINSVATDPSKLDAAATEYLNWRAYSRLLGIDTLSSTDPDQPNVVAELEESTNAIDSIIRKTMDELIDLARNDRNGNAAVQVLKLAQTAFESLLVDETDPDYSVSGVFDRLGFAIVIDDRRIDGNFDDDSTLELVVEAHIELNGAPTTTVPNIPITLTPLGFSAVGQTDGVLVDGAFRTSVNFGNGDRRLRVQIHLGEVPFAETTYAELEGPVEFLSIRSRTGQAATSEAGPLAVGKGQSVTIDVLATQGMGTLAGHTIEFVLFGEIGELGELSQETSSTDGGGRANVVFTPPATGAGTTLVRAAITANQQLFTREFEIAWDNSLSPIEGPANSPSPEAAGLFSSSIAEGTINTARLPGTDAPLGSALGMGQTRFELPIDALCALIDGHGSLANWQDAQLDLLQVVEFQEIVNLFVNGMPANPAELVRVRLNIDNARSAASELLFDADFSEFLPDGMSGSVGIDRPSLQGSLVFGLDTSSSPFYLLSQGDELSAPTSPIVIDFGVNGSFRSSEPLIGSQQDPILVIDSASLNLNSALSVDFSRVATEPSLGGKLRFDHLDELADLRVRFDGDPINTFQGIVAATLRVPGVRQSADSTEDAAIELVGSISKPGTGKPFTFELRTGEFPELPADIQDALTHLTPTQDDPFEENDSPEQLLGRPVNTDDTPSPNLGPLTQLTRIFSVSAPDSNSSELALQDAADWFRFETQSQGTAIDFVRVDFDDRRGDLDIGLYRQDGNELTAIGHDTQSFGNLAQISLLDQPAGVFFIQVFDNEEERMPAYALTISPPGAPQSGFDFSFGAVDMQDVSFVGRIDTDGDFSVAVDGTLTVPTLTLDDGGPLAIGFTALVDNNEFTIGGTLDLTGRTIVLGDDPDNRILEIQDIVASIDATFPFDGSPVIGGLRVEAASAVITPQWPINARVLGDNSDPENVIPGLTGLFDFASGKFDLDLHQFRAEFRDILEVRADPSPQNEPAVHLTFDPDADPSDDLLIFNELTGALPAIAGQPSVTLSGFGFQHDGTVFLSAASFSIPSETLAEIGLPPILDISEFGIAAADGDRITGQDLVDLNFDVNISAALDLRDEGIPVRAAVDGMKIRMNSFAGDNVMSGITFERVEIAFQEEDGSPVDFGPMSVGGTFVMESFDPTPTIDSDPNSIIIRVDADVELAGIGVRGELLITEYGPIAAGLNASFGEFGLPLGPVALYEAGVFVAFNEDVADLPERCGNVAGLQVCQPDPLALIDAGDPADNEFDLSRFRRGSQAELLAQMEDNARDFIRINRDNAANNDPLINAWETPVLFALSGTLGPSGQPRETSPLTIDAVIGANFDLTPGANELVLFGLGEAFVQPLETSGNDLLGLGVVGAVLELTNSQEPEFQLAFATPSPGSNLSELLPADIRFGASFRKEGDELRLDVEGTVNLLDALQADAEGTLILDAHGLYGQIQVTAGPGGGDADTTSLDLSRLGVDDVKLAGQFELMFNLTDQQQTIDRVDPNNNVQTITVPAETTRLYIGGVLEAGGFEVTGTFLLQNDPDALLVAASGEIVLGDFGRLDAEGGLLIMKQQRDENGEIEQPVGAAGTLNIVTQLGIPGLLEVDGSAAFQFNTLNTPINVEVPKQGNTTEFITVQGGPFFLVRIAGSDLEDPNSRGRVSLFPADGIETFGVDRPLGLDFSGRFELAARPNQIDMHLEAGIDVIVLDARVLGGDIEANLAIRDRIAFGDLNGTVTIGNTQVARLEAELDRFGCLHTNVPFLEHLGPNCEQRIFVTNQEFNESSGDQEIIVNLTFPAIEDLAVTIGTAGIGANGAQRGIHYTLPGQITIPRGQRQGSIPVTFLDDAVIESDRAFHVNVVGRYPADLGFFKPADPITEDIEGDITVFDDDTPPIGPPVNVVIIPVGSLAQGSLPGSPLVGAIAENERAISYQIVAPELQEADSVRLQARVVRSSSSSGPLNDDIAATSANAVRYTTTFALNGSRPFILTIPISDDDVAELDENFHIRFEIIQAARFSPETSLESDEASFTIENDDSEAPHDTILFYSFDGAARPVFDSNLQIIGADYDFSIAPALLNDHLNASDFGHSSGATLQAPGLPKLDPTALPDDVTPGGGNVDWNLTSEAQDLLRNGGAESQLADWTQVAGAWSSRLPSDPVSDSGLSHFNAGRLTSTSVAGTNQLTQSVNLADFRNRIETGSQRFRISGGILTQDSALAGRIGVEFFGPDGKSLSEFVTTPVSKVTDWTIKEIEAVIPAAATRADISLFASRPELTGPVPVFFDDVAFELPGPPFYEFTLALDDLDRPLETIEDFESSLGVAVTGIDFWDMTTAGGPTGWELRSSLDDFQTVLSSGSTSSGFFGHHIQTPIADLGPLRPINEPIRFRIYGVGATDNAAAWQVDNLALTGRVGSLSTFPLPPIARDDSALMLSRDETITIDLFRGSAEGQDFDPNGSGVQIVSFGQPKHGRAEHLGGGLVRYTRTDFAATGDSFSYTIAENNATPDGTATANVTVIIVEPPEAIADFYSVIIGGTLRIDKSDGLVRNDSFSQFTDSVVQLTRSPVGDLSLSQDGSFHYIPPSIATAGFIDSFDYFLISDQTIGLSQIASLSTTVTITVLADPNRQANFDSFAIFEDPSQPLVGNVLGNDAPGIGPPLQAILLQPPAVGTFAAFELRSDGTFEYTPPADFSGTARFTYRIGTSDNDLSAGAVINVISVNDAPVAHSKTVSLPAGSIQPITITVSGSDKETPLSRLQAFNLSFPRQGTLRRTGSRTFVYTPPRGGLSSSTSFQFFLRDDGSGGGLGTRSSVPAEVRIIPIFPPPTLKIPSITPPVFRGFNSFVEGSSAWLEANGSRVLDSLVIDGVELDEPSTRTAADGSFFLFVPADFDRNQNGLIDHNEGRMYLKGGTVAATGLELTIPLIAPADATVITPLTTLFTTMIDEFGDAPAAAQQKILATLGLPTFDILHEITIDQVLAGDSAAPPKYLAGIEVLDTVMLVASFFSEATELPLTAVAETTFTAIAQQLRQNSNLVRLSDVNTTQNIVHRVVGQLGADISEDAFHAISRLVAESNARLHEILPVAGPGFLADVARVEQVAQVNTSADLRAFARGDLDSIQLVERNTGDALTILLEQSTLGNTGVPRVTISDAISEVDNEAGSLAVRFLVSIDRPTATDITVQFETVDGDLKAAAGDYLAQSGTLEFGAGITQQSIIVPVTTDLDLPGALFHMELSHVSGAVLDDNRATALRLPFGDDSDSVASIVELLAPHGGDGNLDGVLDLRQSNVVSIPMLQTETIVTLAGPGTSTFTNVEVELTPVELDTLSDVRFPAGEIAFSLTSPASATSITVDFADALPINTWYQFGPTEDNPQPHWFEFLFDGQTGAQLIDLNGDGLVEQVRLHLADGQSGDLDGVPNGILSGRATPANSTVGLTPGANTRTVVGTANGDRFDILWDASSSEAVVELNGIEIDRFGSATSLSITIIAGDGDDEILVAPDLPVPTLIYAGRGNDFVQGGAGDDVIHAGIGNDHLLGGLGNDRLHGASGKDLLDGEEGNDALFGVLGNDLLIGNAGDDVIEGGGGKDRLFGGTGNDTLMGGSGNDQLVGGPGADTLNGGSGNDLTDGEGGDDILTDSTGNDVLIGGSGNDRIDGGSGDDAIDAGGGDDFVLGGTGDDRILAGEGQDEIRAGDGNDTVLGGAGNDTILAQEGRDTIISGAGADILFGDGQNDALVGGAGRNQLSGGTGDDRLFADLDDRLVGGIGRNVYVVRGGLASGDPGTGPGEFDSNLDGFVSPIDALLIINALNQGVTDPESTAFALDVNGDGFISPIDALFIINFINFRDDPTRPGVMVDLEIDLRLAPLDQPDPDDDDDSGNPPGPSPGGDPIWEIDDAERARIFAEAVDTFFEQATAESLVTSDVLDFLNIDILTGWSND
jgi:Ca2+-binding RTX toxin-like protein